VNDARGAAARAPRHTSGVRASARLGRTAASAVAAAAVLWPAAAFAFPPLSGSQVVFDSSRTGRYRLYVKDPGGPASVLVNDRRGADFGPAVSPRGRVVAFTRRVDGNYDLYSMRAGSRHIKRLTRHPAIDAFPAWSPTGAVAFESTRAGSYDLFVLNAGHVRRLTSSAGVDGLPVWSPDGTQIAFDSNRKGHFQIMVIDPSGAASAIPVTAAAAHNDVQPAWSPDGTRIAFTSNRSGRYQIYVVTLATKAVTRVTQSAADDLQPAWSRDGARIAFVRDLGARNRLFTVDPSGGNLLKISDRSGELPDWAPGA
jgi:Tol biopolymer transport system component